jgi:hypothetical protein
MSPRLLGDYISIDQLAAEIGRHPMTIVRWTRQPHGLPVTYLGKTPLIAISDWQAWLKDRTRRPNPERRRRRRL